MGLGTTVLSQAGVLTALIAPQDIRSAIQSGKIFGATIGAPYAIGKTEPKQSTGHIYFPGWHQQYSVLNLMINIRNWENMAVARNIQKKLLNMARTMQLIVYNGNYCLIHRFIDFKVRNHIMPN